MSMKLLSILTSPFWGPQKLDELQEVATKNLETADKLVQDTGENLKKVDTLYSQIQDFQKNSKIFPMRKENRSQTGLMLSNL